MTIYTAIESPGRDEKEYVVFNMQLNKEYAISGPKMTKNSEEIHMI
jgi:hypothetical protein